MVEIGSLDGVQQDTEEEGVEGVVSSGWGVRVEGRYYINGWRKERIKKQADVTKSNDFWWKMENTRV